MLGVLPIDGPTGNRVFIGWENFALTYSILGKYNEFEEIFWDLLGQGKSLWYSYDNATTASKLGNSAYTIRTNFACYGLVNDEAMQLVFFKSGPIN
jgi:hypothetical protein